jgi:RNA polymerase-binding transcription factor
MATTSKSAKAAKARKPASTAKPGKGKKPARTPQPVKPARAAKAAKAKPPARAAARARPAKAAKARKATRPAKARKPAKAARPSKALARPKAARSAKKAARPAKAARPVRAAKAGRAAVPNKAGRAGKVAGKPAGKAGRAAKGRRPADANGGAASLARRLETASLPHIDDKTLRRIIAKLQEMRLESLNIVNQNVQTDLKPREEASDVGDDLDQASTERDREFNLIMHQRHLRRLQQIQDAFERIQDGSYGLCEGTEEPINPKRLLIMPLARYSLEYQEQQEKMLGRTVESEGIFEGDESFSSEE